MVNFQLKYFTYQLLINQELESLVISNKYAEKRLQDKLASLKDT